MYYLAEKLFIGNPISKRTNFFCTLRIFSCIYVWRNRGEMLYLYLFFLIVAGMAELVDAQDLKSCGK